MATIEFGDFARVDIRVGTVAVRSHIPRRVPAIKVWVDFGSEIGERKTSAQLTRTIRPSISGPPVAAVVNFPLANRKIHVGNSGPRISDAEGEVVLIAPDQTIPNGGCLY